MHFKKWYGGYFPELQALANEKTQYAKLLLRCDFQPNFRMSNLFNILEGKTQEKVIKEAVEVSMATKIANIDIYMYNPLPKKY